MSKHQLMPYKVQSVHQLAKEYLPDGIKMTKAENLWVRANQGEGIVVATIDTGVLYTHPDLKDQIIGGKDFTGKGDFLDGNGHGTHVAGTILADDTGHGIVGMAPKAKLLALKALGDDGSGSMEWTVNALRYAIDQKVDIINMSLGGPGLPELHQLVIEAQQKGIIICAASGNEGDNNPLTVEISFPGDYHEVMEVGAVDFNSVMAPFSNTNPEVDILAPGVHILSTYLNNAYAYLDGTSMATPHVAGAMALLKAAKIDLANVVFKRPTNILDLSLVK
jgi:major intracellular serine protease